MAWVRPKHPKPKPKADAVDTLAPMLSYFSNRRFSPRHSSPTKYVSPVAPLSRDPILRSLQQAQAIHAEEPITDDEHEESEDQSERPHSCHLKAPDERKMKQPTQRAVTHHQREPPPPPPPPPQIVRQQPRIASYERPRPVTTVRDKILPRSVPLPSYTDRVFPRAVSARWASATTPLDLR